MVNRLSVSIFLTLALLLIGLALLPVLRVVVGVDSQFGMPFLNVVILLIGGIMCGLVAMILMVRRQPRINWPRQFEAPFEQKNKSRAVQLHACGLLLFTCIPLLNFLAGFYLWLKYRHQSQHLDQVGREVLNFQITVYLYLLLSLFMVAAIIGILTTPLLLVLHLVITLVAIAVTATSDSNNLFTYPANIPIIQSRTKPAA